ncbi:MAG: hypothetical protein IT531_11755 [Burkholderiales bacterium]|nr:hypothetical protein [Burkholderiales bacterium]
MNATLLIYDPTAPATAQARYSSRTLDRLQGKVVGFIDNAKPNFNHLVDDLTGLLMQRYGVASVVKRAKRGASMPAAAAVVEELAAQCDLVITGSGD